MSEQQSDGRDLRDEREFDSGYRDGYRGLSWLPTESAAWNRGWHAGAAARAARGGLR